MSLSTVIIFAVIGIPFAACMMITFLREGKPPYFIFLFWFFFFPLFSFFFFSRGRIVGICLTISEQLTYIITHRAKYPGYSSAATHKCGKRNAAITWFLRTKEFSVTEWIWWWVFCCCFGWLVVVALCSSAAKGCTHMLNSKN